MDDNIILKMDKITKVFPGVKALDGVNFELRKGEVHSLIGENGAGKSTLMKILLGIYKPDGGTITYKSKDTHFSSPLNALTNGISMIHQEISLIPTMDIAENIWIGRESKFTKNGLISKKARYEATNQLLKELNISLNIKALVKDLSIAQMQLVEIIRSASYNADIIIMDEPTSALTDTEIQMLYKIIRDLSKKGVSIIFISHKLEEIFEVCDRVTVLRDGKYIGTKDKETLDMDSLINMIVGRQLTELYPKEDAKIGEVVLEVKDYTLQNVFKNISFSVRKGEILGIAGLMGAGRTEVMRAIFGIDKKDYGEIFIDGEKVVIKTPQDAVKHKIGMVTEDRLRMGSIYALSVMANTTIARFNKICNKLGFFNPKEEINLFNEVKDSLCVKCSSHKQLISQLSGGNQQKVIIGRWLLTKPKILILDEPTRGIDVGSKSEIHRLISKLAKEGMAIIMISSEMPEVLGMSDRVLVVRNGEIVYEVDRQYATQENLITHAFGAKK